MCAGSMLPALQNLGSRRNLLKLFIEKIRSIWLRIADRQSLDFVDYGVPWKMDLCHIAVAPEQRSQGIATQLLGMAITECEHRGVKRILLEVRASNTAAIHCYHQMGFVQIGIRKKYYSQPKEDALLLEHQITNN